jgi:hypothetical protein
MDVVLCISMGTSSSAALIDKSGKLICEETLQKGGCLATLKQLIEEVAPKLMRGSRSQIVAACIAIQSNNSDLGRMGRHFRNDLHVNLGIRAFRMCELNGSSLEDIAEATWSLV